jgi:hypothetical protein
LHLQGDRFFWECPGPEKLWRFPSPHRWETVASRSRSLLPVLRPLRTLFVLELPLVLCPFTPTGSSFRLVSANFFMKILKNTVIKGTRRITSFQSSNPGNEEDEGKCNECRYYRSRHSEEAKERMGGIVEGLGEHRQYRKRDNINQTLANKPT